MGSSHSRASWPSARRKHIWALMKINGHATPAFGDTEVSQAATVICDILDRIFTLFLDPNDTVQLARLCLVNRHWNGVASRILYGRITLDTSRQLGLLLRTLDQTPRLRKLITRLSIPHNLQVEPPRTHNAAGMRLSPEQVQRERDRMLMQVSREVLVLLSSVSALHSLELHARAVPLFVHHPEGPIHPPALSNLSTLSKLHIIGLHDGRWLFLLKYVPQIREFSANPAWRRSDDPALPFRAFDLESLRLEDGHCMTPIHFQQLISSPLELGAPPTSMLKRLEIVDVQDVLGSPELEKHLTFLSGSLQVLKINSSNTQHLELVTKALSSVLPLMTNLTSLETNAYQITTLSPSLKSLTLSLAEDKSFGSRAPRPIGTIYTTITHILDSAAALEGRPLKRLTIEDARIEDYLHFHLVGSSDYNDVEADRQNVLWMRAGRMGVLVVVNKWQQ